MKTTVLPGVVSLVFTLGALVTASAQCKTWNFPVDGEAKAKAEESVALLKDNKNDGKFGQAIEPLNWLLTNTPELNTSLYIYGADIYDGLARKEKDPVKNASYVDSLAIIYDLRIQHCGEENNVLNRKVLALYPYHINTDKAKDLLKMMDRTLELNGNDVMDATLSPYMQTVYMNKMKFKTLTDDEVIGKYDRITEIIDVKINAARREGKPVDKYQKYQEEVDKIFNSMNIPIDCDRVKKNLEPKFRADPSNADLARKIFYSMLQGKCTDDQLWLETGEKVLEINPDVGIAKNLAIKYQAQDNYAKAEELFKKSLSLAESASDKGDILLYLARIEARRNKVAAREYARQALAAEPGKKEAYELIGDLYIGSFKECSKEQSHAEDRLIYIAAYEMYAKAGDREKMALAKSQFPSTTEIFILNWKEGDEKKVDCWVGETVILRTRGKS